LCTRVRYIDYCAVDATKRIEYGTSNSNDRCEDVSADELIGRILQIKAALEPSTEQPLGIDIVNEAGDRVSLAFNRDEGMMMCTPADENQEILYTLSDPRRSGTKVFMTPDWTEVSAATLFPKTPYWPRFHTGRGTAA